MQKYIKQALSGESISATGYMVTDKNAKFKKWEFSRHPLGKNDVLLEILYAGICHSDIHAAKSEWRDAIYPMVPGHEICGRVVAKGAAVTKFEIGDIAGVGCMVNSCGACEACKASHEQFCSRGVFTYDSYDVFHGGKPTYGGYSDNIVLNADFAIKIPATADLSKVAPLLCAGITTYSPLKFSRCEAGKKVAVAGFGGLGVMAVKYAVSFGAEVSVFARNEKKKEEAFKMGVKGFFTSTKCDERFDIIISTIPTRYSPAEYVRLLKYGGEMGVVGLPPTGDKVGVGLSELIFAANKKIYGSLIGGIKETQEMLDFSVKNGIYPEVELITPEQIDEVYEKMTSASAKFRYVIDMKRQI